MKKILVVEDNGNNLYLIRFILEKYGYRVIDAGTGVAGVEAAIDERPDLIIGLLPLFRNCITSPPQVVIVQREAQSNDGAGSPFLYAMRDCTRNWKGFVFWRMQVF